MKENEYKGNKLTQFNPEHIRLFYININGVDTGKGKHTLVQLYQHLNWTEIDVIEVIDPNIH